MFYSIVSVFFLSLTYLCFFWKPEERNSNPASKYYDYDVSEASSIEEIAHHVNAAEPKYN